MTTSTNTPPAYLPPPDPPGLSKWIRDNLFGSISNSILTILAATLLYFMITNAASWMLFTADWRPVTQSPLLYVIGQYPRDQMWRVGTALTMIAFMTGVSWGKWNGFVKGISIGIAAVFAFFALLPVSHPQLTLGMRLYLGGNVLAVGIGYLVGRIKGLKPMVIGIAWLVVPVVTILLFAGFALLSLECTHDLFQGYPKDTPEC